ncbi:hypothetical protein R3P38DRAFT_2844626 [Favolaschia claudopus]|uniref:Uncharacterized protein n=1 Tax=Favolaschia claudopus TaxID=2862362 RepID=A0AAW0DZQ6_9AGAR
MASYRVLFLLFSVPAAKPHTLTETSDTNCIVPGGCSSDCKTYNEPKSGTQSSCHTCGHAEADHGITDWRIPLKLKEGTDWHCPTECTKYEESLPNTNASGRRTCKTCGHTAADHGITNCRVAGGCKSAKCREYNPNEQPDKNFAGRGWPICVTCTHEAADHGITSHCRAEGCPASCATCKHKAADHGLTDCRAKDCSSGVCWKFTTRLDSPGPIVGRSGCSCADAPADHGIKAMIHRNFDDTCTVATIYLE